MKSKRLIWLSAVVLASWGLYVWLAWRYPLAPSLAQPRATWFTLVAPSPSNAAQHIAAYLGLTLLYLAILRLLLPSKGESATQPGKTVPIIIVAWLACSGVLMAMAPGGESHDVFDYLFRGRLMAEYQENPLVKVPEDYGFLPYNRFLAWRKYVDTYGPAWEAASAAVARSVRQVAQWRGWWLERPGACPGSPDSCRLLIAYVSGYRLLAIGLSGLAGGLIYSLVKRSQARLAPLALAAWLLSPMTLIATALGGHNDALMLVLALSGWWLLQRERPFWALLALILAAQVKLTALIWLPVVGLWIVWRRGWRQALLIGLAAAAAGLALSWLLYAPFGGWQVLPRMLHERALFVANSPWQIFKELLVSRAGWPRVVAQQLSVRLANGAFALGALLLAGWRFNFRPGRWREAPASAREAEQTLWRTLAQVSLLYLLAGSFWFQHWYVLWVLAPAALLPDRRLTLTILPWLAFGALTANTAMDYLLATALKAAPPVEAYIAGVALIWGPAALAAGISALARRLNARRISREARQLEGSLGAS